MLFKNVIGNRSLKKTLINEININQIPHAQLFLSKDDANTIPMALAFITYLFCEDKQTLDSCNQCHHCVKMNKLSHPDLHFFFPSVKNTKLKKTTSKDYFAEFKEMLIENPSVKLSCWTNKMRFNKLSKDSIRTGDAEEINRIMTLKPYEGKYSIFVIWHPELMHDSAANKLLKGIEEPNKNNLFLLLSNNSELILPTIKSRLQIRRFNKIDSSELLIKLNSMFPHLKDDLIKSAIQENENNYIDTCNQLSNNIDKLEQENSFISWARLCFKIVHKQEVATLVQWCNTTASLEIDKQRSFLTLAMSIFRKAFLKKYILKQHIYPDIQNISFIDKFSKHIDEDNIYDIYALLDKANYYINRNVNSKLIFLDLSFSIGRLLQNKQNNSS